MYNYSIKSHKSHYGDKFYNRMVAEKRIDVLVENQEKKARKSGKDLHTFDINSIRNKDVREIGAEWLSYQAITRIHISSFLELRGWDQDDIKLKLYRFALFKLISNGVSNPAKTNCFGLI